MDSAADKKMEVAIGHMLRVGVVLSGIVVAIGGAIYLDKAPSATPSYSTFRAAKPTLRTVAGVLEGVRHLDPASLIQLGILMLIATPIVRVVYCVVGFSLQRDRMYMAISTLVLAILVYSLLRG